MTERRIWLWTVASAALLLLVAACRQAAPAVTPSAKVAFSKNADGYADITVAQLAD